MNYSESPGKLVQTLEILLGGPKNENLDTWAGKVSLNYLVQ